MEWAVEAAIIECPLPVQHHPGHDLTSSLQQAAMQAGGQEAQTPQAGSPLQMAATPTLAFLQRSTFSRVTTRRAPLAPMGCPMATAPPNTFTLQAGARYAEGSSR